MIEYTAINIDNNKMNITLDNKYKNVIKNICYDFKIVKELWWFNDGHQPISTTVEPPDIPYFNDSDYEITLEFKSEYDRDFFDYLFDSYCNQVDKLEYNYKELEVTV